MGYVKAGGYNAGDHHEWKPGIGYFLEELHCWAYEWIEMPEKKGPDAIERRLNLIDVGA